MSYKIFGAELSPYSVKIRSYFRFKGLPHEWVPRSPANQEEFQRYARIPLVPLVVTPKQEGLQDSTPIMDAIEQRHPAPSIHPEDKTLKFLSILIEEFADEWGNKWMFHYRWARQADQLNAGTRLARGMAGELPEEEFNQLVQQVLTRMTQRVWLVGSNETTAPLIEKSFHYFLGLLNAHLAGRDFLFGSRPCYGDLGLWAQLYEMWLDPTPGSHIASKYLNVLEWIQRMCCPTDAGSYESWATLAPSLRAILQFIGGTFMPWTLANEQALAEGAEEFSYELGMGTWTQKPQKYHAKSLAVLRQKYQALAGEPLDGLLAETSILDGLRRAQSP